MLFLLAVRGLLPAQDIQVVPAKDQILNDTICAKYGTEFSQKDPFGRRVFAQWLLSQMDTRNITLEEPVLIIVGFKVDESGKVKKVKQIFAQNSELADMVEKTIDRSAPWIPYVKNGKPTTTHELFGIVFQPAKAKGENLRPGYFIAPQYPKDGINGYIDLVDKKIKNADFRFDIKEYIKQDLNVQFTVNIDQEGKVKVKTDAQTDPDLAFLLKKKLEKSEKWIPGLYLTKPIGYAFQLSYVIPAWNEEKEGEKIQEGRKEESTVNKEIQRRAAERERQAEFEAARAASGSGGGGGGGGRIR